jgi:secreted trypsin-like serine protease
MYKVLTVLVFLAAMQLVSANPAAAATVTRDCGKRLAPRAFVYNGKQAKPYSWPWLAAFTYRDNDEYFCAGSLVSKRHVVTGQ